MKNSIKREKSQARMSFAEYENQRSLAEGESNVRATLKHMKLSFNFILTLAVMLTMAQTTWAATKTETRTATWYMDGGTSGITALQDDHRLVSGGMVLKYVPASPNLDKIVLTNNGGRKQTSFNRSVNNAYIEFTNLEGTVKSVELTNFIFYDSGMQMYVGLNKDNTSTLLHLQGTANDYDFPSNDNYDFSNSVTFEGNLEVSSANPLRIIFSGSSSGEFCFNNGVIAITYEVEVEDTSDPGHTFSFSSTGNTLTATCNQTSQYHTCGLTSGKSTLVLTANDASYDSQRHNASLNLSDFMTETGITDISSLIEYTNKATSNVSMTAPASIGEYTVTATVTIGDSYNYNCTLTKDFSILAGYKVNNIYSQFSLSKSSALEGEEITITYTQQMDEGLDGLTLTGATSGNNITYTQSGNTYTFNMPAEDVNLSATFTYPLNENDFTQSGDTYTIKTAEGWNYFCRRLEVDGELNGFSGKTVVLAGNITVTTMAGSTDHPFKGTFDGDGYTLTFNYTADRTNCAPFRITDGVTIRNLHATGQIEGGAQHYLSGLVGSASGNLTIENCRVSTQISSTVNGIANNGGLVGLLSSQYNQCHITGCVFDGLICNSNTWNQTYGCGGFIGSMSQYGYAILKDCLFLHGQYDNNGNKCELYWGYDNDRNSTFLHRSNDYGGGTLTNCFYVGTRGLKQGSPAVESADAPDNFVHFGTPTDHGFLKVYGHTMVFDGKYYTPTYGDLVETYSYSGVKYYNIEYDDAPLGIPNITSPLWTECLRYNRSFTKDKPVTIMLPFNFKRDRITLAGSNENPSGKFYEFKGIDNSGNPIMDEGNEVMENTLEANHPYLYMPAEDTDYLDTYVSSGINIFTQDNGGGSKVTEYEGFELRGTYTEKVWEENDPKIGKAYVYNANGELVPVAAGTRIRPTECYILKTKTRMTDMGITVTIPSQEWTGSAITFDEKAVVVKDGETTLTLTTDYTVTAPTGTLQNTGDYTVTINGAGNYAGSITEKFTIVPKVTTYGALTTSEDQSGKIATIDGTTTATINIPTAITVDDVTYNRSFTVGKASTIMLPFDYTCNGNEGGTFYRFVGVEKENNDWVATMQAIGYDSNNQVALSANTPYLFMPEAESTTMTFPNIPNGGVRLCTTGGGNGVTADAGSHWTFKGTYKYMKWTTDTSDPDYNSEREAEIGRVYGFAGVAKTGIEVGDFVKAKSGARIRPMTCYLMWNDTPNNTRGMTRGTIDELPSSIVVRLLSNVGPGNQDDDDNQGGTTAIGTLDTETGEIDFGGWYDMSGRKLSVKPTQKGLYIHNGKKVIIK